MAASEEAGEVQAGASAGLTQTRILLALLAQGTLFTLAGLGLWVWSGREAGAFLSVTGREIALGLGFAAALILVAATLFRAFPRTSEQLVRLQAHTYREIGRNLGWPGIVAVSLIAGISEEAAIRAGLQTVLGDALGAPLAILLASVLFALVHMAKPLITVLLFGIGLVFGLVYWATDSLLAVIIGHALYDVWALRYLIREMHRLDLFDAPAPLAKPAPSV